jgi:hypothetical protein
MSISSRVSATTPPGRNRSGALAPPRNYDREELQNFVTPLRRKIWLD